MAGLRQRPGDQPLPVPNGSPDVQSMVISDIGARRELGISRYGTALQPANGRDALRDLYEELLDSVMYVRQVIAERDGPDLVMVRRFDLREVLRMACDCPEAMPVSPQEDAVLGRLSAAARAGQ